MSDTPKPSYLLFKSDGSGLFPMYCTTEGKVALMWFRSRETADAFIAGKGMSREWQVEEFPQGRFVDWVRGTVRHHGASEIAVDPDPAMSSTEARVIPIIPFRIEWEG